MTQHPIQPDPFVHQPTLARFCGDDPSCGTPPATVRAAEEAARRHLPLSVWLAADDGESAPACDNGCCVPVSGPLTKHLVSACTRLGETVIDINAADHHLISNAISMG
ncbi:hypothetical protein Acor_84460 [Acrocarpospora corrugata]|uniref:Uncharacterized protein n=1 Tax=Acrocarpospora corrugata TaxID=35763 RepID=A0A5M3WBF6_9ACTN|nr:hypothetical protein [Acrocarpospora corrugata]GES06377.1 hypothetical protein Acor_84460 [Acrocarpospora corrugata]